MFELQIFPCAGVRYTDIRIFKNSLFESIFEGFRARIRFFSKQKSFSPLNPGSKDIKMTLNGVVIFELWLKNWTGFAFDSFENFA